MVKMNDKVVFDDKELFEKMKKAEFELNNNIEEYAKKVFKEYKKGD